MAKRSALASTESRIFPIPQRYPGRTLLDLGTCAQVGGDGKQCGISTQSGARTSPDQEIAGHVRGRQPH